MPSSSSGADIDVEFSLPPIFEGLADRKRYSVIYGGRGGAKSWSVARYLLWRGMQEPTRVLCCREFQNSIADSVHRLLADQIADLDLGYFYEVQRQRIVGHNGSEFLFMGLRHNVASLKSVENVSVAWVEEAHAVSRTSWETLIPTIRKPGSEIIVTFNPQLETDDTYKRFVVNPPPNAWVQKVNWGDNPHFPDVLEQERQYLKATDPDAYANVWEGHCRQFLEGAIYAEELRAAELDGRITRVPKDPARGVNVFVDLGWSDKTSLWFAQSVAMEFRVLAFYQDRLQKWEHYLRHIQSRNWLIDTIYLPHDGASKNLQTGRSIEELTRQAGFKVQVLPAVKVEMGINAARTIFPSCYFDAENCADGLQALRHYRFAVADDGTWSRTPDHDENSHAADAFRYLAMALTERRPRKRNRPVVAANWMG